ncbi:hypothetical protein GCM10023149_48540 [Mucilaginibacter gynuensis]|uniref:Uncharacterized protein n=1 Tax=Mucilaginibacter gynuensis TaxID=1302236 RepID=A0ABP8HFD3_9SPHI
MSTVKFDKQIPANIDGFVSFVLNEVEGNAALSQALLPLGTKTALAQMIERLAKDPFTYRIETLKRDHEELVGMVNGYVISYLEAKKDLLIAVYKYNTPTGLNYFLILKDDNFENREVFFEFLDQYEALQIDNVLPVNITFLPLEAEGAVNELEPLNVL